MAFQDYINKHSLQDTGGYLTAPGQPTGSTVGNQPDLRFILQPIHGNSSLFVGGTDQIDRDQWGANFTTTWETSVDYVEWLNGTAESTSDGINIITLQPNAGIGRKSQHSGNGPNYMGPQQHLLLAITSNDTYKAGDNLADVFEFHLQGVFRCEHFRSNNDATTLSNALTGSIATYPINSSTGTAPYIDHRNNTGNGPTGLLDYYVLMIPLFNPNNTNQLNPNLGDFNYEDEMTGETLKYFSTPGERFSLAGAIKLTEATFADTLSSNPSFSNLTVSDMRSRMFISYEPIQTGVHHTQNRYVRPHFNGEYNAIDLGVSGLFATLNEAVSGNIFSNLFDYEASSWWNLIIKDTDTNAVQHIGNVNYSNPQGQGPNTPLLNNTLPAIDASMHCFGSAPAALSSGKYIGGGILVDSSTTTPNLTLKSGVSLDTDYSPENTSSGTIYPEYGGLKLFPDNTLIKAGDFMGNTHYRLVNMSVQNYNENTAGIGQGVMWNFDTQFWDGTDWLTTEDKDFASAWVLGKDRTNATYTGYGTQPSLAVEYTQQIGTTLHNVQTKSGYSPLSIYFNHQVIAIRGERNASFDAPYDMTPTLSTTGSAGPSALYYNLAGICWSGLGAPAINYSTVDASGCSGSSANGEIHITTDLLPLSLENSLIQWVHPVGQTLPTYVSGAANHSGPYTSYAGSSLIGSGSVSSGATGLIAGLHTITLTEPVTGCTVVVNITIADVSGTNFPTIYAMPGWQQPTCANNDGILAASATGGVQPYTFSWTGPNGFTATNTNVAWGASILMPGLAAGTYSLSVVDAAGCPATNNPKTFNLAPASSNVDATLVGNNISCNGLTDGSITITSVTNTGSTTPYPIQIEMTDPVGGISTASWSSGNANIVFNNLEAGSYSFIFTDQEGCTYITSVTILEPTLLTVTGTITLGICSYDQHTMVLFGNGGTPGYSYAYKAINSGTWIASASPTISGLVSGQWDFKIIDASGCETLLLNQAFVHGPTSWAQGFIPITMPLCNGDLGEAFITLVNDGTNVDTSNWSIINYINGTGTVAGTVTASNFQGGTVWYSIVAGAGTYDAVWTDQDGCSGTYTYTIAEPDVLSTTKVFSDEGCGAGGDGSIGYTTIGGTPAYSYSWTKDGVALANTTDSLSSLSAGTFIVTIVDTHGCTITDTTILLDSDVPEDLSIAVEVGPTCTWSDDGTFTLQNTIGDFPFQLWFSTTSATTGFLQIIPTAAIPNTGNYNYYDSIDLANLVVDNTWVYLSNYTNISLPANTPYWVYLVSTVNGCVSEPTQAGQIPASIYVPMVLSAVVTIPGCCDECGGEIDLTVTNGKAPFTYVWTSTAPQSTTQLAAYLGATTEDINTLCPGDYTVVVTDACNETETAIYTVPETPVLITDIQYVLPYCADCDCGSITVTASGGDGNPLVYSCNNGVHWVDTDPGSTDVGPVIFNIASYNTSTVTPGKWETTGFGSLDEGIYRIWVRDHSSCAAPMFDDTIEDCNPGGLNTCVNFCSNCLPSSCYSDFVDIFADHSVAIWNGGTKVELVSVSTLNVTILNHSGPAITGGNDGSLTFAVKEDYWWAGMEWYVEVFVQEPLTSTLVYDSDFSSATYGDVCCDVPGTSACNIDCCVDIPNEWDVLGTSDGNLSTCTPSACPGNASSWCQTLTETSNGVEICPNLDANLDSIGYYTYTPIQAQMGTYVLFDLTHISIVALLGPIATEAMVTVRVTNNVSIVDPTVYTGQSGNTILAPLVNCDDCAAAVLDNGMINIINTFGAEDCACGCPPGFFIDERQYITTGTGLGLCTDNNGITYPNETLVACWGHNGGQAHFELGCPPGMGCSWIEDTITILNPDYNTCVGFLETPATGYGKCYDAASGTIMSEAEPVACNDAGGVWRHTWTGATISQNMPCCVPGTGLGWGYYGAKLFGDWSSGSWSAPVPIGQDISLLPYTTINASTGHSIVQESGGLTMYTDNSWGNAIPAFTERLKDIGIWPEWFTQYPNNTDNHFPINEFVGVTICTEELLQETNFIVGLAADSAVQFFVDGKMYLDLTDLETTVYEMWNLFPIALEAGTHTLEFRGTNASGPGAFAFDLYPFMIGSTPTVSYLADPTLTALDLQGMVITDYAGNPISSEHYIGKLLHTTETGLVGYKCPSNSFVSPCGGTFSCSTSILVDIECPNCEEELEDLVGCAGNLMNPIYQKLLGGMLDGDMFNRDAKIVWSVLLIKYLIKRFAAGFRGACITPEKIVTWTRFLARICPDCGSNIKDDEVVNYLPDPNEGSSPIDGIDGADDINTFDF